jgi:hypothetical protein
MQPFHYKHILILLIAVVSFPVGKYFWRMPNIYIDLILRSGLTALVYTVLSYYLHVSDDLNEKIDMTLAKVKAIVGL